MVLTRRRARVAAALALVLAGAPGRAAAGAGEWLLRVAPTDAKLQLAGNVGLLSAGPGWAFWDHRLELDLLVGWVPKEIAGADLVPVTAKVSWLPWATQLREWRLRPLALGLGVTYTHGNRFYVRLPDSYPSGYYPVPSALRATISAGSTLTRPIRPLAQAGIYWEVVAVDVPFLTWARHPGEVRASDVFSVALGFRAER